MRYENWDVLLFPGSNPVPLQEFRTECHVVPDSESLPLSRFGVPTLNTFVPSLPFNSPFSISILSWGKPSVSQATRSYSNHFELVLFEFHVYIDGRLVSTAILDQNLKGPYSIRHSFDLTKNGEFDSLRFPAFHNGEILQQRFWSPSDDFGRIKVSMTESFPRDSVTMPFERVKNVVVFSFQYAPLEILESSAIAWPNPIMWHSAILNNIPPKPDLSGPKFQNHLGLSHQSPAEDIACPHAVLRSLASLQSPTKANENNPSRTQGRLASDCSFDSVMNPVVQDFAVHHGLPHSGPASDVTVKTAPELAIQRNLCNISNTNGCDQSSMFGGFSWPSETFEMPFSLTGPSYLGLKEQCSQTVLSGLPTSTYAAAENVPDHTTDVNSGLLNGNPHPKTRASSREFILHHRGPRSPRMKNAEPPATKVISRKECRTRHAAETAASLNNPTTNILKPGVGQQLAEPVFALIDHTFTTDRSPSLQKQSRRFLEVPEPSRRSSSLGASLTNTEKQETVLSTKRSQGNQNFTPLATQGFSGGSQLHG
ncbi:hypothetical protein CSUB01_08687 [Colletotrichum sublineola]|uniref:Uncharacterized protein n=1 Tax=Colletotrichum sublineola TaxID=1173701 RepID=A0A066XH05_COLSU|nr:hypothetical protein CSUB01_08687 [Colletotrichum sublineola]